MKKEATHPLGRKTEVIKRLKQAEPEEHTPDAPGLLCDFVETVSKLVSALDAGPELSALTKRLTAAIRPRSDEPDSEFALELLPPSRELKRRLLDVFKHGTVPHLVWTHVHRHGTVRASDRPGHLRVHGVHGWTTLPKDEVARQAMDRMQTRLQKMWRALEKQDPRAAVVLRPAMQQFAAKRTIYMDGDAFGMGADVSPSKAVEEQLVEELATSLEEYATL